MKSILILGAGRSSGALINYLLNLAHSENWRLTIADADIDMAAEKLHHHPAGDAVRLDATDAKERKAIISKADVVISMLPAFLHSQIARDCLLLNKNLVTASYISSELAEMTQEVEEKGLVFMNEIGLDPGIDHMSAMKVIHRLRKRGLRLNAFRSYTGGLVAPESDTNPWHYKITWNPGNVVRAGQGTAQYLEKGMLHLIPYNRLFRNHRNINIAGLGDYEVYPNRDSLVYIQKYGLEGIPEIFRGTIRGDGFCRSWDALVQLGLTDATYPISDSERLSYRQLIEGIVRNRKGETTAEKTADFLGVEPNAAIIKNLNWLGLFSEDTIKVSQGTPASIIEARLLEKWALQQDDKDMIIMQHEFDFVEEGKEKRLISTMVTKGKDAVHTAMSKLVGLPLGIYVKFLLQGKMKEKGILIPVSAEVYEPVLNELESFGVSFLEEEIVL